METSRVIRRIGDRVPADAGLLRTAWHDNGLSIVLMALFVLTMTGQIVFGWLAYNADQRDHGEQVVTLVASSAQRGAAVLGRQRCGVDERCFKLW